MFTYIQSFFKFEQCFFTLCFCFGSVLKPAHRKWNSRHKIWIETSFFLSTVRASCLLVLSQVVLIFVMDFLASFFVEWFSFWKLLSLTFLQSLLLFLFCFEIYLLFRTLILCRLLLAFSKWDQQQRRWAMKQTNPKMIFLFYLFICSAFLNQWEFLWGR